MAGEDRTEDRATPTPPHLWTVEEANRRLAGLNELLPRLKVWAARLEEVQTQLRRITGFWGNEVDALDQPDHDLTERLEAEWRNLARRLEEAVSALRSEGIEVKDLSSGLVDFYALEGGELVFLCWRRGEAEVGFFHTLESGFLGRRPLPARPRSLSARTGSPR